MKRLFRVGLCVAALASPALAGSVDDFKQGIAAMHRGDRDTAIADLSRALARGDLAPNLRPIALVNRGVAHAANKQFPAAIADFSEAVKLKPDDAVALSFRARVYAESGNAQAAAADCHTLTTMRPRGPGILGLCGYMQWKNGQYENAVFYFDKAVAYEAARPEPLYVLWLELVRMEARKPDQVEFSRATAEMNLKGWPEPILDLDLGKSKPETVMAAASKDQSPPVTHRAYPGEPSKPGTANLLASKLAIDRQLCGAEFFVGEWQLLHRDEAAARDLLTKATNSCPKGSINAEAAGVELKRMAGNKK